MRNSAPTHLNTITNENQQEAFSEIYGEELENVEEQEQDNCSISPDEVKEGHRKEMCVKNELLRDSYGRLQSGFMHGVAL